MPVIRTAVVTLLLGLIAHGSAWAQPSTSGPEILTTRMLNYYGLERAWWNQATIDVGSSTVRYLTLDEENVYVQSTSGMMTAFDNETGKRLWAVHLGSNNRSSYPAVSNETSVLVIVGSTLYSLKKFTGEQVWEIRLPQQPSTSPAVDDKHVYVGCLDGSVFAFNLRKVRQLYEENLLPQWSNETLQWRYQTGREITTPPISSGNVVNFASRDGSLYTVTSLERQLVWQFETDAPVSAPLASADGYLLLASEDYNVYSIQAKNGQVRWEFVSGSPIEQAPVVIGKNTFLIPIRGGMFCLNTRTGEQLWRQKSLVKFVAATATRVYASDEIGNIGIVSRDSGEALGKLPVRNFGVKLVNTRTNRIYMATQNGLVVCLREKGQVLPSFHLHPDRLPLMPEFEPEVVAESEPVPAAN